MFYYNYHTHTTRCGHASGTDREYIEEAIRAGIRILGFSDHSDSFFDRGYIDGVHVKRKATEQYITDIRCLAEEYKNDITIYVGFESKYDPRLLIPICDFCRDCGVDYLLLGQHSLTTVSHPDGTYVGLPTEDAAQLRRYVDEALTGLSTGYFSYLCHPDLFNFTGNPDVYIEEMTRLCRGAKALAIPLEINLWGMLHDRAYPSDCFFEIAIKEGNDFVVGFDAHMPSVFSNEELRAQAECFLEKHGIALLDDVILRKI